MPEQLSILWRYAQARRRMQQWPDRSTLRAWQEKQIRQHLRRVARHSPFFQARLARHGIEHWQQWPVSHKSEMMANFSAWNTARISVEEAWDLATGAERSRNFDATINGITVGLSSGSSGSRALFLASPAERRLWAGTLLARILRGSLLHRHRAALFLRADSPLYRTVGSRRFQFSFFDTLQPLEQCWNRLVDFRPTVLAAPPSVLVWLADQPGAGRLLAPPGIVLSVADVLEERERERIERGFGSKVGEIYQATEGFLAATCPHGRMHWNEDAIFVEKEWLDESRRRFVPVITDFRRLTQPIIRYRLDDVILQGEGGRCECGSIFETLGAIEGRCDDLLDLPRADGCGRITVFPDLIRRAAALALPAGVDYLIRQTLSGGWEAAFSHEHPPEPLRREIEELCRRLGALPPELRLIPWTPLVHHVKRRRVRRESSPPGCSAP